MAESWNLESMILYEDKEIIVCRKPAGFPVQSKRMGTMDLESALKNYLSLKNPDQMPYIGIVHRLDQPVEGVLVLAKTAKAAAALNKQFQSGEVDKVYLAIAKAAVTEALPKEGGKVELRDYLLKDGRTNTSKVVTKGTKGAKEAMLSYEVLEEIGERKLLKIHLGTGRHHQIRVQMAHHGMPLEGDRKYGNDGSEGPLALCSYCLTFSHPKTGKKMKFEIHPEGSRYGDFLKA